MTNTKTQPTALSQLGQAARLRGNLVLIIALSKAPLCKGSSAVGGEGLALFVFPYRRYFYEIATKPAFSRNDSG